MLTMKVFDKEIFEAVKHIDPLKASGPDVMKANFYHQSWNSVGNSVCKVAKSFFTYRHMIQELKRTYITLIPRSITGILFIIIDLLLRHSKLYWKTWLVDLRKLFLRLSPISSGLLSTVETSMMILLWPMKSLIIFQKDNSNRIL